MSITDFKDRFYPVARMPSLREREIKDKSFSLDERSKTGDDMSESSLASMPIDQQMKPPEKRKAGDPITRKT